MTDMFSLGHTQMAFHYFEATMTGARVEPECFVQLLSSEAKRAEAFASQVHLDPRLLCVIELAVVGQIWQQVGDPDSLTHQQLSNDLPEMEI